ncbi:MAG: phospholipid/cholesterol/gamma-HCH transport system substrate-binding protein, partial [Pseudonocardiales bacterium]|nr:phospholipid/cholesterol/gamma-HCH transport system substrate-binding protein [Pseudonocardiales bacterium]
MWTLRPADVVPLVRRHLLVMVVAALLTLAAVATVTAVVVLGSAPTRTIIAEFRATPGLYAHNDVDILGVPTGEITSITAGQDVVRVTMHLPRRVRIPAGARAVLMAPNPVSDRFVELYPPYTGGPALADGAVIPVQRTVVPLELDQIFTNLDDLATALGPTGANSNGSVDAVLNSLARVADGNGTDLHTTLVALADALPAF